MWWLLYAIGAIAVYKLLLNRVRYIRCRRYLDMYLDWLADPTWEMVERKSRVVALFRGAGLEDIRRPHIEAVGYGRVATSTISVIDDFPSRREDVVHATVHMFHEGIGVYRSRIIETFNPQYWLQLIVYLPRNVLAYLGVPSEKVVIKVFQLVYWVVGAVAGFLLVMYRTEVETLVRAWVVRWVP